jgi:hypothetical protein
MMNTRPRTLRRAGITCALAGLLLLAAASPAAASAPETETGTDVGVDAAGVLQIVDRKGDPNTLQIRRAGSVYEVTDDGSLLVPGEGCGSLGPRHQVYCRATIAQPMNDTPMIVVEAVERDDVVLLPDVPVAVKVSGGPGDDLIQGGAYLDDLDGGLGDDTVIGLEGNDTISGGDGGDFLLGGTGGDTMTGDAGADVMEGERGSGDNLDGGAGPDLLKGGAGDDVLKGGGGSDVLVTNDGKDIANTGTGADRVFGTKEDRVTCRPGDQVDTGSKPPPAGCVSLPGNEKVPDVWPPLPVVAAQPGATPVAARAATPDFSFEIKSVKPLRPKNVKTIVVAIRAPAFTSTRAHIQIYRRHSKKPVSFDATVNTRSTTPPISSHGANRARRIVVTAGGQKRVVNL